MGRTTTLGFFAVAAVLYGPSLGIGYLGDDFLYLEWLDQGFGELLRKLTVDSNPRVIRPLSTLGWTLTQLPAGGFLLHALSLGLHTLTALMVVVLIERSRRPASTSPSLEATVCGLLFLACPLLTEPVLWASAHHDLWAAGLALGALALASAPGARRQLAAAICFALALLAKESVVVLPLVALCWALAEPGNDGEAVRRPRWVPLSVVAGVYLLVRFALFGGLGGYLDPSGQSIARQFDPLTYLRNLGLQLPYRLAMPLKRAGDWTLPVLAASSALLVATALRARLGKRGTWPIPSLRRLAGALAAFLVATAPVAPVLSVDVDHGGGRLIYFPLAIALAGLGRALVGRPVEARRALIVPLALWLVLWVPILLANTHSWRQAGREVRQTLDHLVETRDSWPSGATVWVDGNDSWHGAYVWRNGFDFALRRADLEPRRPFRLGTLAEDPEALSGGDLGRSVFQIERDVEGRWHDQTPCLQALVGGATKAAASVAFDPQDVGGSTRHGALLTLEPGDAPVAVVLTTDGPTAGHLAWRHPGIPRFNVTERRPFRSLPGQPTWLLLPRTEAVEQLELQIDLDPATTSGLQRIEIHRLPELH